MITEEEAKKKWCPLSRPVFPSVADCGFQPGNRDHNYEDAGNPIIIRPAVACIGSACMAWRREMVNAGLDSPFDREMRPTSKGYCGAFGNPAN